MSGAQRAFWVDLLALAGRSRCDGVVCAGLTAERFIGYPLSRFEALDAGKEIDTLATLELFERTGKIKVEITSEDPLKLYKITILNWSRYQSEYDRQKGYRQGNKRLRAEVTDEVTTTVTTQHTKKLLVEGEVEGEPEKSKLDEPLDRSSGEASEPSKRKPDTPPRDQGRKRVSLNPDNFTSPKK
jgi:hypothetical protein